MTIFNYNKDDIIGQAISVDTSSVIIKVEEPSKLQSLQVNHLISIRSSKAGQHLIGMINKITRRMITGVNEPHDDETDDARFILDDIIRITLIGTLFDKEGKASNVFHRTLETVPEVDAECFRIDGDRLSAFMKSISINTEEGIQPLSIGKYTIDEDADALLDGNKFFQRHAVIVGSTGSGKSWTVAHFIEQASKLPSTNAILFDIHGEYNTIKDDGIKHLRIAGPSDLDGKKGLADGIVFLPYWLLKYEEMLSLLLDRSDNNAPNQAMVFSREVQNEKRKVLEELEKENILANFTVDSPIPYPIENIIKTLSDLDSEMVQGAKSLKQGPFHGKLTRFIQRLKAKKSDRRLGFMFSEFEELSEYEWMVKLCNELMDSNNKGLGGVKIIDFSEVPSDILPLIISLVARIVFTVQQWMDKEKRHPISLFCDEAHLYIPHRQESNSISREALNSFERIAKEGRKYGVGLVIVSQRPAEVNRTVLSQCNNFVAMRLTNAEDQSVIKRLLPDSLGGFSELLPILDIGEALVVGDACILPSRIRIDKPVNKPASATVDFWDKWSEDKVEQGIAEAVESLRKQSKST